MLQWCVFVLLAVLPLMQGCAAMKTIDGAQDFEMLYFEQGDEDGKLLYQFSEIGENVVPHRMLVDMQGRFLFLERFLNRVQCFSSTADWVFTVEIPSDSLGIKNNDETAVSPEYLDMFWCADSALGILIAVPGGPEGAARLMVVKCDKDGLMQSHYELKSVPTTLNNIESAFCDGSGFLWIAQDDWFVFDQFGNFNSTVKMYSHFVDTKGYTYSDAKPVRVSDRFGKIVATLASEPEPTPDLVTFVGDKGELVSWARGLPETKTPTSLALENQVVLFKLDRDDWHCDPKAKIAVPATEFSYPSEQSDQADPVQVYLPKMSVIQGGNLYLLAYSAESFWISKLALGALMK